MLLSEGPCMFRRGRRPVRGRSATRRGRGRCWRRPDPRRVLSSRLRRPDRPPMPRLRHHPNIPDRSSYRPIPWPRHRSRRCSSWRRTGRVRFPAEAPSRTGLRSPNKIARIRRACSSHLRAGSIPRRSRSALRWRCFGREPIAVRLLCRAMPSSVPKSVFSYSFLFALGRGGIV